MDNSRPSLVPAVGMYAISAAFFALIYLFVHEAAGVIGLALLFLGPALLTIAALIGHLT